MSITRKNLSFAQQIAIDRRYNWYVYGGNWNPFNRGVGTDCSGCVIDELDASINGTAMSWSRSAGGAGSTEAWRPPSMGGHANPSNGPFGTVMVDGPNSFPKDAAVQIALHHGPGGGENSHMWCLVDELAIETHGGGGRYPNGATVLNSRNSEVFNDQVLEIHSSYANNWWYLPGPIIEDGTPIPVGPSPLSLAMKATGHPTHHGEVRVQHGAIAVAVRDENGLHWQVRNDHDQVWRTTKRLAHASHWRIP